MLSDQIKEVAVLDSDSLIDVDMVAIHEPKITPPYVMQVMKKAWRKG